MRTKPGFTIIELLIVIVIIGLLTSVASISFVTAQRNARDNTRKTNVQSIATAVETYYAAKRQFPGKEKWTGSGDPDTIKDCETVDSNTPPTYRYYYKPGQDCTGDGRFTPAGAWIPNLGPYLNPFPSGDNYSGDFTDPLQDKDGDAPLTLVYRHLDGRYAVYTKLESAREEDEGIVNNTTNLNTFPFAPHYTDRVYLIQK